MLIVPPLDAAPKRSDPTFEQVIECEEAASEEEAEVTAKVGYEIVLVIAEVLCVLIVPAMFSIQYIPVIVPSDISVSDNKRTDGPFSTRHRHSRACQ